MHIFLKLSKSQIRLDWTSSSTSERTGHLRDLVRGKHLHRVRVEARAKMCQRKVGRKLHTNDICRHVCRHGLGRS